MSQGSRCTGASEDEVARGERFLAAYAAIEQAMRRKAGRPSSKESFRRLVDILYESDWSVRKFRSDLEEFADLRNAMVHERVSPNYLIAVPLPETVEKIEKIRDSMTLPPLVYPKFKREVLMFSPTDPMDAVFRAVTRTGYSQFPIYDNSYRGLLTDGGIARWVAKFFSEGRSNPGDVAVREVLASQRCPDRGRFVSKDATVYEAMDLFRVAGGGSKGRVAAVLITDNGLPGGKLLGIITPTDALALSEE